ncbi:MAG TPA: hypothetical protein VMW93_04790 [bacterium]|nr:hypothetical protein [bacterium]
MRKIIVAAAFVAAATLLASGCGKKAAAPPADELTSEIAAVAGELNAYLSEHNFANTDAGALADELNKLAAKYGELEKQAHDMRTQGGGEQYGDVGNLAGEGRAKAEALASTIAAGAPMGDAVKATALNDVVGNWADYSDRVGAPPGEAAPAEGDEPSVGEPAAPGEPGGTAEPAEPGTPRYPGKGHHYGWWKNPEWARDRGTRPITEGDVPGTGEMLRERERERDRSGKGTGPEREREREHMQPGSGKGGGMGPGGGKGAGGGDAGKGGGGKGRGGK